MSAASTFLSKLELHKLSSTTLKHSFVSVSFFMLMFWMTVENVSPGSVVVVSISFRSRPHCHIVGMTSLGSFLTQMVLFSSRLNF